MSIRTAVIEVSLQRLSLLRIEHPQANPLTLACTLRAGESLPSTLTLKAEVHASRNVTAETTPLASSTVSVAADATTFEVSFSSAQLNQTVAPNSTRQLWLVVYGVGPSDTLYTLAAAELVLGWHAISQITPPPPSVALLADIGGSPWGDGAAYQTNHIVGSGGSIYLAVDDHVASASTEPGVGADWQTVWALFSGGAGSASWGSIGGTLSNQTDLQAALNGKADTSHTHLIANVSDSTTVGQNLVKLTTPAAVSWLRVDVDGTVTARDAAGTRSDLSLGSVAQLNSVSLTSNVSGVLPIANGGTGASTAAAALMALGAYPATNPAGYTTNTGTVTSVTVASVNGVSATVANQNTTPQLTIALGEITPSKVNGIAFTASGTAALAVTGTASIAGTNTGDQTITLSGDATGSGTGSITVTLSAGAVTYSKIQNVIGYGILANPGAALGSVQEVTVNTDQIVGRAGSANIGGIACTTAGRALLDDATPQEQVRTLTTISGRTDTNASFSLSDSDNGTVIVTTATTAINVTVPSSLSANFSCLVVQGDTGQLTFVVSGTTINSFNSLTKTAGRYAAASLVRVAANTFILSGQLA